MAVTSLLTSLENFNGSPTLVGYGGGQGATTNTDIIIEGAQSGGRRADNVTDFGFGAQFTAADLSAAGEHIRAWLFVTQWPSVTQVQARVSSGADDDHDLPSSFFPKLGGFLPVWVDVSRAPEVGGSANEASISEIGILLDIGDVGGNAQNLILDEIMHGTSGYRWDGTGGDFDDFRTFEDTNNEGVFITIFGADFLFARLEIGSATATGFVQDGFNIICPDQPLVATDWMGFDFDLQTASTDIDLSNGTIQSSDVAGATNRFDIIVTGTNGALDFVNVNLLGARTIDLTSGVTIDGGILQTLNLTQNAATIQNCTIRGDTASQVAVVDDATFADLDNVRWVQAGSGHAIEITQTGTYTFDAQFFEGYGGTPGSNLVASSGANDAAILNSSGGAVTINVINGGDTPSVRNTASSTTTVNNTVTVRVTAQEQDETAIQNARVYLEATGGGDLADGTEILNDLTNASGVVEDTGFNFTNPQQVTGRVRKGSAAPFFKEFPLTGTITASGFDVIATMTPD